MKFLKKKKMTILMVAFAVISLFAVVFLSSTKKTSANNEAPVISVTPVKAQMLELKPFSEYLEITGTVKAHNQIDVIVEEPGILKNIIKDNGSYVSAGDTLAILNNLIIQASYREAAAVLKQGKLELDSKKVLFDKKAIPENEYLAAQYNYDRALAGYELAKARVGKLAITAPHKGVVNDRYYDLGAYATPLSPIFNLIDNNTMKITAGVAERFLRDVKKGTPVEISFDAFPELNLTSAVHYVYNSIDPASRTFQIEIEIANNNRILKPEMIANLKLERRKYENQIVIPIDAVIDSEDGRYVYLVKDNQAQKSFVDIRAIHEDSVLVDGLAPQENLIVLGQHDLTDGDSIEIIN